MKTQIVTFTKDGAHVSTAIGRFDGPKAPGRVRWLGEWAASPPSSLARGLPSTAQADLFLGLMASFAKKLGFKATCIESGEWNPSPSVVP